VRRAAKVGWAAPLVGLRRGGAPLSFAALPWVGLAGELGFSRGRSRRNVQWKKTLWEDTTTSVAPQPEEPP